MSAAHPRILPGSAVLELTYRCNHKCLFCYCPWYAGKIEEKPEMTIPEWKACVRSLVEEGGVGLLTFTGGECLLKPGWQELALYVKLLRVPEWARDEDSIGTTPSLIIISNGRAVDEEVLQFLAVHDIALTMSLPGITTYRQHTDTDTDPADILDKFIRAHELGIRTIAGITITALNYHEAYQTVAAALLAHVDQVLLNRFLPGGRGLSHPELLLTLEQVRQLPAIVNRALEQAGRYGGIGTELPYCAAPAPGTHDNLQIATTCGAAATFFAVGPSGYIRVCNHSPKELVHWTDWRQLADDPYWQSYIHRANLPDMCKTCAYTDRCDGGCREAAQATFGSKTAPDPILSPNGTRTTPCPLP